MAIIRTATETLVSVMEEFGDSEPKDLIVIYTNQAGELVWSCSTDSTVIKLGLIESCRTYLKMKLEL